jgi:hypothetical protein
MTILWIAVWVAISVFIVGVFIWTTRALFEQKKTWAAFAAARGLEFIRGRFLQAATVRGQVGNYDVYITSEARFPADFKGRKFVTLMQFGMSLAMPTAAMVGSGDYRIFVNDVVAKENMVLSYPGWTDDLVRSKTDHAAAARTYFTPERLRVLDILIKQPKVSVLFLFDERGAYLRLETTDPFLKPGQLDRAIDGVLPMLRTLVPDDATAKEIS